MAGNVYSTGAAITLDVPQGSILGPMLLLIFINDMSRSATNLHFIHFANDATAFNPSDEVNTLFRTINDGLSCIDHWLITER